MTKNAPVFLFHTRFEWTFTLMQTVSSETINAIQTEAAYIFRWIAINFGLFSSFFFWFFFLIWQLFPLHYHENCWKLCLSLEATHKTFFSYLFFSSLFHSKMNNQFCVLLLLLLFVCHPIWVWIFSRKKDLYLIKLLFIELDVFDNKVSICVGITGQFLSHWYAMHCIATVFFYNFFKFTVRIARIFNPCVLCIQFLFSLWKHDKHHFVVDTECIETIKKGKEKFSNGKIGTNVMTL